MKTLRFLNEGEQWDDDVRSGSAAQGAYGSGAGARSREFLNSARCKSVGSPPSDAYTHKYPAQPLISPSRLALRPWAGGIVVRDAVLGPRLVPWSTVPLRLTVPGGGLPDWAGGAAVDV